MNVFNWNKLDPYMGSFAQTGAEILQRSILKPPVLYPRIDHNIWRPNNVDEWQNVIYQLVRRYSVEQPIVTYWEHVNVPDIGTWGGCPYRIPSVEELHEFYKMTMQPVLQAFPRAKIGGPCPAEYQVVPGFVDICARNRTQLDFCLLPSLPGCPRNFSYHGGNTFSEDRSYPGKRPELMINEWNKGFEPLWSSTDYDSVSVEEMAMQPRRAAHTAKILLTMLDTPLDWSFYFLLWDSCMHPEEFVHFFSPEDAQAIMYKHWNEASHRFGLFSESGKPRPQYFVYQILSRMGEVVIASTHNSPTLTLLAVRGNGKLSVLIVTSMIAILSRSVSEQY